MSPRVQSKRRFALTAGQRLICIHCVSARKEQSQKPAELDDDYDAKRKQYNREYHDKAKRKLAPGQERSEYGEPRFCTISDIGPRCEAYRADENQESGKKQRPIGRHLPGADMWRFQSGGLPLFRRIPAQRPRTCRSTYGHPWISRIGQPANAQTATMKSGQVTLNRGVQPPGKNSVAGASTKTVVASTVDRDVIRRGELVK